MPASIAAQIHIARFGVQHMPKDGTADLARINPCAGNHRFGCMGGQINRRKGRETATKATNRSAGG
jgi:hypothetical protein